MIHIKSEKELERMRVAGRITALARKAAADAVHPGVTTEEIDRIVRKTIEDAGAKPSFLGYGGFPGSACVSINDEVIHGIPSKTHVVREGDIVKVDVGAYIHGYHGDCAATIPCGEVSDEAKKLIAVTRQSFFEGIKFARVGYRVSDIGAAVQAYRRCRRWQYRLRRYPRTPASEPDGRALLPASLRLRFSVPCLRLPALAALICNA